MTSLKVRCVLCIALLVVLLNASAQFRKIPADVTDSFSHVLIKQTKLAASWPVKEILYIEEKDKETKYRIQVRKSNLQKKNLFFSASGQLHDFITLE